MKTPFASRFAAIAATFVIAVSGSALAQHRPHGHGAGGADIAMAIAALKG